MWYQKTIWVEAWTGVQQVIGTSSMLSSSSPLINMYDYLQIWICFMNWNMENQYLPTTVELFNAERNLNTLVLKMLK